MVIEGVVVEVPGFGPGVKTIKGQNIISVPIKDAKKELTVAKTLFEGANFVTIDAAEHDFRVLWGAVKIRSSRRCHESRGRDPW